MIRVRVYSSTSVRTSTAAAVVHVFWWKPQATHTPGTWYFVRVYSSTAVTGAVRLRNKYQAHDICHVGGNINQYLLLLVLELHELPLFAESELSFDSSTIFL